MQTTLRYYSERARQSRKAWSHNANAKRDRLREERHAEAMARIDAEIAEDDRHANRKPYDC